MTHVIYAYDHTLLEWAREGLAVSEMQRRLREMYLYVGRDAILSVIGGHPVGTP